MRRASAPDWRMLDGLFVGMGIALLAVQRLTADESRRLWLMALVVLVGYGLIGVWVYANVASLEKKGERNLGGNGRSGTPPEECSHPERCVMVRKAEIEGAPTEIEMYHHE